MLQYLSAFLCISQNLTAFHQLNWETQQLTTTKYSYLSWADIPEASNRKETMHCNDGTAIMAANPKQQILKSGRLNFLKTILVLSVCRSHFVGLQQFHFHCWLGLNLRRKIAPDFETTAKDDIAVGQYWSYIQINRMEQLLLESIIRHDICQNVYTSRLWTCHILPENPWFAWVLKRC